MVVIHVFQDNDSYGFRTHETAVIEPTISIITLKVIMKIYIEPARPDETGDGLKINNCISSLEAWGHHLGFL